MIKPQGSTETEGEPLRPGALCHHGTNTLPAYRVVWIDGDKAWLRDVNSGEDAVVDLCQCVRIVDDPPPGTPVAPTGPSWPDGSPRP